MIVLTSPALDVRHGFFGRTGGVSPRPWASLNVGLRSGDAPGRVLENRALIARRLGFAPARLAVPRQAHGPACVRVDEPWAAGAAPEADALVTDRPGVLLGVVTADCAPVLLVDARSRVIGAAHAGWKGALAGVTDAAIAGMVGLGAAAERIHVAIGPAIGVASYEVGPEFEETFTRADGANARFFARPAGGRARFDLPAYVEHRLRAAGIGVVERLGNDTLAEERDFFSYRRATLRGDPGHGLQLSAVGLAEG